MKLLDILNMGGYAFYVWSAYGITLAILACNVLLSVKTRRNAKKSDNPKISA